MQPGWAGPPGWPAPPATPYDVPQPYWGILRTRRARWWTPLLVLVVSVAVFLLLALLVFVPLVVLEWDRLGSAASSAEASEVLLEVTPLALLITNLSLAAAIPAAVLGLWAGARLRPGWLASVAGRMRWGVLGRCLLYALLAVVASSLLSLLLPGGGAGEAPVSTTTFATWAAYAAVVLLTTPLQAAGEEYAFRGVLLQVIGAWVRWPVVGGLVSALLFALAHGQQDPALFLDRFAFGLVAWILVLRTGGLEASIALHTVNNAVVFLVAAAFGQVSESLSVTQAPWAFVVLDVAQMLLFWWLVERGVVRRGRVTTVTPSG